MRENARVQHVGIGEDDAALLARGATRVARRVAVVDDRAADAGLDARIAEVMRDVTKLRGNVERVAPGSLPNDGKVIEDARSYQ